MAPRVERGTAFSAAVVALTALGLYANSLGNGFVYDDPNAITGNAAVVEGDVRAILTTPSWWGDGRGTLWRPVTTLTFALDYALFGAAPFGFHLVNVGLHALVSVLVLVVFARAGVAPAVAFAAAALFASHPVHTEAVANVVGRAELLAAAGFLLAWWCWLAADVVSGPIATARTASAAVVFFLALLAKENAIALPVVAVAADLLGRGTASPSDVLRRRAPGYGVLVAVALGYVALRRTVVGEITPAPELLDNPLGVLPTGARLVGAVAVVGLYALRLVVPLRLSADYSYDQIPVPETALDPRVLAGLGVIVGVAAAAWWARRRLPALTLGLLFMALTFALVSNLVVPIGTIMGERLLYLPSAGFCVALAAGLAALGRGRVLAAAVVVLVALYGGRTLARNPIWREPLVFFSTMTADAPRSARAHAELGTALAEAGRLGDAEAAFARALAIKPEDPVTLYNWGVALGAAGRFDDAAAVYRRAIAAKPDFGRAFENLGGVESARGDQAAALAALRRARELTPESPYLLMTIANVQARAGADAEARATFEDAVARRPRDPLVLTAYGTFLHARGDDRAAIAILERIAPPRPDAAVAVLAESRRRLEGATP
jgi:Flp pilus assembly protein TadD